MASVLKERNMTWKELCNSGISVNVPAKFSHNKVISTDTLDKVCECLDVQPGEITEWISKEEYENRQKERLAIEAKIAELQAKLKAL